MSTIIYQVDAFTSKPFSGNPAGVCILNTPQTDSWMQSVAVEMNLSETAFLVRDGGDYSLRWFTPGGEVDLCGHATLASAHVLRELGLEEIGSTVSFHTASGILKAQIRKDQIVMDFPAEEPQELGRSDLLTRIAGDSAVNFFKNRMDNFAELQSEDAVKQFKPDSALIRQFGARGFGITAKAATDGLDFVSRYFAPAYGIEEDPVTGSTHCTLTPYWAKKLGKQTLTAAQLSARGGILSLADRGERVEIAGPAITTMRIELVV